MAETPVWLEDWRVFGDGRVTVDRPDGLLTWIDGDLDGRAELAAAAPPLARFALQREWSRGPFGDYGSCEEQGCDECGALYRPRKREHREGCELDATLTKAGFPTPDSRADPPPATRRAPSSRRPPLVP